MLDATCGRQHAYRELVVILQKDGCGRRDGEDHLVVVRAGHYFFPRACSVHNAASDSTHRFSAALASPPSVNGLS